MPVSIRPYRRFNVHRAVTYRWPNEQRIDVPVALVR